MDDTTVLQVPKARLDEEIAKRKGVETELAGLRTKAEGHDAHVSMLMGSLATSNAALETSRTEQAASLVLYQTDRALMADGITDPGMIDYIRFSYKAAPGTAAGGRPEFGAFLTGFKTANPALFTAAPAVAGVAAVVAGAGAPAVVAGAPAVVAGAAGSTDQGVVASALPRGGRLTPQEIARLTPEQMKEHGAAIMASLKPKVA